jgi:hypothetical protein
MELGIESPVEAKSSGEHPVGTCSGSRGSEVVVAAGIWGRRGAAEKAKRRRADLGGEAEGATEVKGRRDHGGATWCWLVAGVMEVGKTSVFLPKSPEGKSKVLSRVFQICGRSSYSLEDKKCSTPSISYYLSFRLF